MAISVFPYWLGVAFAVFTVAWGGNQYTPMLVYYRQQEVFSPFFIDLMLVFYAFGVAAGLLVAGPMSDRFGRKPVMLPTPALAAVASLLIAVGEENQLLMTLGRICAGLAVGIAMTAGGAWVNELSKRKYDTKAKPTSGAKRASMSLTAGFALGPAFAGMAAQWLFHPGQLPYAIHILLAILGTLPMLAIPETRHSQRLHTPGGFKKDMSIPSLKNPRFLLVVAPMGPWVFGAGFTSYAILPSLTRHIMTYPIAMTALVALLTLGSGFAIQQVGPQIAGESARRGPLAALSTTVLGMGIATYVAARPSVAMTLVAAVFLGLAYGLCSYIGLAETQRIATPEDMAGLTGIFYCLSYVGMLFPAALTMLSDHFTYPMMLGFGVAVAAITLVATFFTSKKYLPAGPSSQ